MGNENLNLALIILYKLRRTSWTGHGDYLVFRLLVCQPAASITVLTR